MDDMLANPATWERVGVITLLVAAVFSLARGHVIPASWHRQRVDELVEVIRKQDEELSVYRDMLRKSHEALLASAQSARASAEITTELSRRKS